MAFVKAAILLTLAAQARSQLLSCSDINCPKDDYGSYKCEVEGAPLEVGVSNFSSALSSAPLSWTVGYAPRVSINSTDERRYYLGAPAGLDLEKRSDISGCALFFTGIEAGLTFAKPNGTSFSQALTSGTCADALGSECETDLVTQARGLVGNSTMSGETGCTELASILQSSPPLSCTKAGTWGNVTAKTITGPDSPSDVQLDNCNPAINNTYSVRDIVRFPMIGEQSFSLYITPLMTIFTASDNATSTLTEPEVHLNCMKPILAESTDRMIKSGGGKASMKVQKSLFSVPIALMALLAVTAFMG